MARYGGGYRSYDRGYTGSGGTGGSRYGRAYPARGYDRGFGRGYGREYEGGWGMTNLFNTIMHGGPRGRARYAEEFYHRPGRTPYGSEYEGRTQGAGGGTSQARRSPDSGSIGVHYRGTGRGRY